MSLQQPIITCDENQNCFIATLSTLDIILGSIKNDRKFIIKEISHCEKYGYHIFTEIKTNPQKIGDIS